MRRFAIVLGVVAGCSSPKRDCPEPSSNAAAIASAVAPASPSASITPADRSSLVARGARGELSALKELERVPVAERSVEQSAAIAAGHAILGKEAALALGRELQDKPELLDDRNVLAQLFSYASDPVIAEVALPVIARIERPVGPDMLYELQKHDGYAPTRSLAEDLLGSRAVKRQASKQLEFVMALDREERCERVKKTLEEDAKHADRRVLPRLEVLEKKTGCGDKKNDDCFPCLRETELLSSLRAQVEKLKKQPREWEIRRR